MTLCGIADREELRSVRAYEQKKPAMYSFIRQSHCVTVLLMSLAWCNLAFCGEIHEAVKRGDLVKIKAMIQANPDLVSSKDADGRTPLHWAAAEGRKEIVVFLLANKADIHAKDNNGETPYDLATTHGDVAEFLRQNGGKKKKSSHDPAIFDAAASGDLAKVKELVEDDPDIVFSVCTLGADTGGTALGYPAHWPPSPRCDRLPATASMLPVYIPSCNSLCPERAC